MARAGWVLRKLGKAVALYERNHPDSGLTFYDLPYIMRRDFYARANTTYNYRNRKDSR